MIDSLWSLLASRYSDLDSWLDLKYMGTHIVENLMKLMDNNAENKEQAAENVYETLANLKEAQKSELNNSKCFSGCLIFLEYLTTKFFLF